MANYSDIEIQPAKNLMEKGYKWIARNRSGKLRAYHSKPSNRGRIWLSDDDAYGYYFCEFVPIFHNISIEDSEPTSLEAIVHPQLLDDAEKRYLKGVIRPFRNDVEKICKNAGGKDLELIAFYGKCYFFLPYFDAGTMYKGMKLGHKYSLEELGL